MKIARYLPAMAILGLFVTLGDLGSMGRCPHVSDSAASDPADSPCTANLILTAFLSLIGDTAAKSAERFSQEEIDEEIRKLHGTGGRHDKDWLLRGYEQQEASLRAAAQFLGIEHRPDESLFMQLSSNKELAKLAGLPTI